jgi:hypothetical protein
MFTPKSVDAESVRDATPVHNHVPLTQLLIGGLHHPMFHVLY